MSTRNPDPSSWWGPSEPQSPEGDQSKVADEPSGEQPEGTLISEEVETWVDDDEGGAGGHEPSDSEIPAGWAGWLPLAVLVDLAAVLVGLAVIFYQRPWDLDPAPALAGTLVIVVFVTFGGVFARTGNMRTSLGATLVLTYMVVAIVALNVTAFAEYLEAHRVVESVFQTLIAGFTTVLVFYFVSEAYIKATSIKEKERTKRSKGRKRTRTVRRTSQQQK